MQPGSVVLYLPDVWEHGTGTIMGSTKHGWLWVQWQDGHFDKYDPMKLELADEWEHRTVEAATHIKTT